MKIRYTEITVEPSPDNSFLAKCKVLKPFQYSAKMIGRTAEIAKEKLILFLDNKPYTHLDKI